MNSISIHRIEKITREVNPHKIEGQGIFYCMTLEVLNDEGQKTSIKFFSNKRENLSIKLTS